MPGHQTHDAAAVLFVLGIVIGALIDAHLDLWTAIAAGVAFIFSSCVLSPDLDVDAGSRPYNRWGPFKILWWPYARLVGHRSWFSHGPVIGTVARTLYLVVLLLPVGGVLWWKGAVTPEGVWTWLSWHPGSVWSVLGGLEAGTLVHLVLDKTVKN